MRKTVVLALWAAMALPSVGWGQSTRDRVARYFSALYSVCPGTDVSVAPAAEIAIPGYDAYRVERRCDVKNRNELSITLVDSAREELFVGEVLHSGERGDRPFVAAKDVPVLEAALRDVYGLPSSILLGEGTRGALIPIRVSIRQAEGASASLPGFVSQDGATLLLGEFRRFGVDPDAWRERLLSESPGVRPQKGSFLVTAFIDFQCEKCRHRTPQLRDFVWAHGGALEIRFLPLVKVHDWAFAAAESASALANVSPSLYAKYEEAIFPRSGAMNGKTARELAADVADSAGAREAYERELSSGRARARVLQDIELALKLGLNSTPFFFYRGALLTGEPRLAEDYIQSKLNAPRASDKDARR